MANHRLQNLTKEHFNLLLPFKHSTTLSQFIYTAFVRTHVLLQMIKCNFLIFFKKEQWRAVFKDSHCSHYLHQATACSRAIYCNNSVAPPPNFAWLNLSFLHSETVSFKTATVSDNLNPSPFQIMYHLVLTVHRRFARLTNMQFRKDNVNDLLN